MDNHLPFYIEIHNPLSEEVEALLTDAYNEALKHRHEYVTPEHLIKVLLRKDYFTDSLEALDAEIEDIDAEISKALLEFDKVPEDIEYSPTASHQMTSLLEYADINVLSCDKSEIEVPHILKGLFELDESWARYILWTVIEGQTGEFLSRILSDSDTVSDNSEELEENNILPHFDPSSEIPGNEEDTSAISENKGKKGGWKNLVVCINDIYKQHNPLIGREEELSKTIRVLCRKDKNNPLHIGEPGVGKTALVYGLASLIDQGKVPEKLQNARIYRIDLGSLIAGTQYRGDFEKKIKAIMDGVAKEKNAIVYIDEIHNLVGAGAVGESSLDASNFLKPYLEGGGIRFIGATTYDEYKRYFARNKSIVRRFTNIDITEPTVDQTIEILRQLQKRYEDFHGVKYTDSAIEFAAKGSATHINDRYLPDKAIDLIDESGAEKQMEKSDDAEKIVDKELVSAVLAKICKVESLAITEEDPQELSNLEERISSSLFGQDRAVAEVSETVLMSKAGLGDENKPLASLLFVGPTGVGKTELAKLLSSELGIELIRFDMSEYTEKHTVAKLIGSPAGYVGYEDGGLLTDAIRKTPNAVLLLDEIEKAHPDIYNILLQVMDYAKLTDNKGNKADFRNVILIMTSNAGAQYAAQANVGFASTATQGDAMLKQVKKTFKPEFLNRLSATVVFNDMSREMAALILEKKLKELKQKLTAKNVSMILSEKAKDFLLEKGFTKEYGARELDRVIHHELKRLLTKQLLYGALKDGGQAKVDLLDDHLVVESN